MTAALSRRAMLLMTAGFAGATIVEWPSQARGSPSYEGVDVERAAKDIPSIALALVGPAGPIYIENSGFADAESNILASGRTAYRLGSFAGLFSDLTILRLAQDGAIDLDESVGVYLSDLRPPSGALSKIRVRDLLLHRSGLPRELRLDGLNETRLVAAPGGTEKYSDADRLLLDQVIERVTQKPIAEAQADLLTRRIGMTNTALSDAGPTIASAVVIPFDAPRFVPPPTAGSWLSTIDDLAKLARSLLTDARSTVAQLSLNWSSNAAPLDSGYRRLAVEGRHGFAYVGAAAGYTAYLAMLPHDGLATVVLLAVDNAHVVAERLGMQALRAGLAKQSGKVASPYPVTVQVPSGFARKAAGTYRAGDAVVTLRVLNGRLYLESSEMRGEIRCRGADHVVDDLMAYSEALAIAPDFRWIMFGNRRFERTRIALPTPPPQELESLIGDYGSESSHIRIYENKGRAYALVNGSSQEPLIRIDADTYDFSATSGLYRLERLRFTREPSGRGQSLDLSGIILPRRDFGLEMDVRTRAMARFAANLRSDALAATPPIERRERQSDLVELKLMVPEIKLDMRYATTDNFMGIPFYESKRAFLQRPAAEAVARAQARLMAQGYGLAVHDAYRPWYITRMFWEAMPPEGRIFLADPAEGSRHNRGCAIDVTLYNLATGMNVTMPGAIDEVSSHSSPLYLGGTTQQRWLRDLLKDAMEAEGFTVDTYEWWHFDYPDWPKYPILNVPFERISSNG